MRVYEIEDHPGPSRSTPSLAHHPLGQKPDLPFALLGRAVTVTAEGVDRHLLLPGDPL